LQAPPPFYDFEQQIDIEIKELDKWLLQDLKEWDEKHAEIWRRDTERRLYRKSTMKRRKGDMLLHTGRRRRRSLSVYDERRQQWRRIPMPRGRESGLVALSSLHDLLVLFTNNVV